MTPKKIKKTYFKERCRARMRTADGEDECSLTNEHRSSMETKVLTKKKSQRNLGGEVREREK